MLSSCNRGNSRTPNRDSEKLLKDLYELVWKDEFDYSGLPDSTKWIYDTEGNDAGWGNNEAQFYTVKRLKNAF